MHFDDAYNAAADLLQRNLTPDRRDRPAVIDVDGVTTYAELAARAARFAAVLDGLDVHVEQRVALCLTDTVAFPTCFLGALQHGAVAVPINTRLTEKDYTFILADSRATVLVVTAALLPRFRQLIARLPLLRHVLVVGDGDHGLPTLDDALAGVEPSPYFAATRRDDMGFWLYTSGTTGEPKGAVHAHGHLIATAELYAIPTLDISRYDTVFSAAKLYFAYGLGNALTFPMAVGATAVLLEGPPTPEAVADVIIRHQPTIFYGVPTLFGMLLAHQELLPAAGASCLRLCTSAGEALPPDLLRRWKERMGIDILDGLGSTEALHIFLTNRVGDIRPGSTGKPVRGYDLRLLDEDDRPVDRGELGNLEVSGPTIALMYWNKRDRSKHSFRGDWMRTGDKYRQDEEGYYYYGGRSDDLMKVGGIWVSPFEVESALIQHPAVLECAVVAHENQDGLVKPKAFVVTASGHEGTDELGEELIDFVREHLAAYKRPRWVEFVDELPKTATGKIRRFMLR